MSIPQDLIPEILSNLHRLPGKSLVRFQCVSKSWFTQINDPNFIQMHIVDNNREEEEEGILLVQTWNCKADQPLNYYLANSSNENHAVKKVFPPFHNPEHFPPLI
jgi:hypothetical protein